jgi:hypothetical protein
MQRFLSFEEKSALYLRVNKGLDFRHWEFEFGQSDVHVFSGKVWAVNILFGWYFKPIFISTVEALKAGCFS